MTFKVPFKDLGVKRPLLRAKVGLKGSLYIVCIPQQESYYFSSYRPKSEKTNCKSKVASESLQYLLYSGEHFKNLYRYLKFSCNNVL